MMHVFAKERGAADAGEDAKAMIRSAARVDTIGFRMLLITAFISGMILTGLSSLFEGAIKLGSRLMPLLGGADSNSEGGATGSC